MFAFSFQQMYTCYSDDLNRGKAEYTSISSNMDKETKIVCHQN